LIASLARAFVFQAFYIPSGSMLPTLHVDDRVIVSRIAYRLHAPRRGDVVVFDAPPGQRRRRDTSLPPVRFVRGLLAPSAEEYVKRVVGLPGDRVEARNGHVQVNGRVLVEPYLPAATDTEDFPVTVVPEGRLFVIGDNRAASLDSRSFGPIRRSSVVGRVVTRVWPPHRIAFL
jgi:signal peptidase I